MRKLLLGLSCVAVIGLTSCLGDSDDNNQGLTPQEVSQCYNAIKGSYTGKLLCEINNPDDPKDYVDTLDIAWSVTSDTMVVINRFPQAVILDRIADNQIKEALQEADPAPLRAQIAFYNVSPLSFLLYPYSVEYDIDLDGEAHKAVLSFWVNTYSFGQYSSTEQIFRMQFMIAGLFLDKNTTRNYLTNAAYDNSTIPIIITSAHLNK